MLAGTIVFFSESQFGNIFLYTLNGKQEQVNLRQVTSFPCFDCLHLKIHD